jgi:hypothetical protein
LGETCALTGARQNGKVNSAKKDIALKLAVVALALLLVLSSTLAVFEHNNVSSLQSSISERDTALVERGKVITWLDTALNLTQLALNLKPPNGSQYLTTLPDPNSEGRLTKVFLLSAVTGYAYDPYTWPFNAELRNKLIVPTDNGSIRLPDFGWWYLPGNYEFTMRGGDYPVLMIGVTVRNDYTPADSGNGADPNAPISTNPYTNRSSSWIALTAVFYGHDNSIIQVADTNMTQAPTAAIGGHKFALESGETTQIVFYFSPPNQEVDHYKIFVSYLSAYW